MKIKFCDVDKLFLNNSEVVIPKDKWNKLLEILENHKDEIEHLKWRIEFLENKKKLGVLKNDKKRRI